MLIAKTCALLFIVYRWALDEITETIRPDNPEEIRSAVYRTFVSKNVNKVPQKEKDKAKKLKNIAKSARIIQAGVLTNTL